MLVSKTIHFKLFFKNLMKNLKIELENKYICRGKEKGHKKTSLMLNVSEYGYILLIYLSFKVTSYL